MASNRQVDGLELTRLELPYDKLSKIIQDEPRIIAGSNVYVDRRGTIRKCGGLVNQSLAIAGHRIDRMEFYDAENGRRFLIASAYDTANTNWSVFYLRLDGASSWTEIPDLRDVRSSAYPHEFIVARNKVFIKGFPGAAGDKLGSVIFDGTATPVTQYWGLLGPTTPARRSGATSSWTASSNDVDVYVGWKYVYTWVTSTGHESSRSPLETDPAQQPSDTGAFTDKRPRMVVQGHSDTTNVPYIRIYRTLDGGGSFLYLDQITNTGSGSINYDDTNRTSTPGNPKTDTQLDTQRPAPSITSNAPPASTEEGVLGTATVERCSPIGYWNGRIWYGIGRNLYFSGNDEIRAGNIEEAFPTGTVTGNRLRFRSKIIGVRPTVDSLLVFTTKETIEVRGTIREEIEGKLILASVGGADQREAYVDHESTAFWLDQHNRIRGIENRMSKILSDPLGTELTAALDSETNVSLTVYQEPQKDWLILALHDLGTPANSRWWILDLSKLSRGNLWSPPWTKDTTALTVGITEAGVTKLYAATFSGGNAGLAVYDDATYADLGTGFAFSLETNLFPIQNGNHIHRLTVPATVANTQAIKIAYIGNTPTVSRGLDSVGALTTITGPEAPQHGEAVDAGYLVRYYPINSAAERVRLGVSRSLDTAAFSLESLAILCDATQIV